MFKIRNAFDPKRDEKNKQKTAHHCKTNTFLAQNPKSKLYTHKDILEKMDTYLPVKKTSSILCY